MKRIFSLALAAAVLFLGISSSVQAQMCEVGCYESSGLSCAADLGYAPDCGVVSCYGDDGCYETCDIGYCGTGCCFGGIGSLFSGVCSVVMTPIHWVASIFTCGTFPDCGCAPPQEECYSNPCDICGNYVGDCCGGCGNPYYGYTYQDYYMATQQSEGAYDTVPAPAPAPSSETAPASPVTSAPAASAVQQTAPARRQGNPSLYNNAARTNEMGIHGDYVNYSKVETIGQKKLRRRAEQLAQMNQTNNQVQAGEYSYSEQVYNDAAVPTQIPSRAAVQNQNRTNKAQTRMTAAARPAQRNAKTMVRTARASQNKAAPYRY